MAWILYLLAAAALLAALFTPAVALGVAGLLASLLLTVAATMTLLVAHAESGTRAH
ncbi:MAG: hypothetical protein JSR26_00280 [Proteobacteria bacterium]|nr:hypothetical protein [Pseudomonadota bacterium]